MTSNSLAALLALTSVVTAAPAVAQNEQPARETVHRVGQLAKVRPDRVDELRQIYESSSEGSARFLREYEIQNFSIYLQELEPGQPYLFKYFEYTGDDFEAELERMRQDRRLQQWAERFWGNFLEKPTPAADSPWIDMEEVFFFSGRDDVRVDPAAVKRFGQVIGVRPEMVEGYKQLHAHPWQGVLDAIRQGNLRNYPIYMTTVGEKVYIFGYFEYVGQDFAADMQRVDSDPVTVAWIKFTDQACQLPLETRAEGEWWANMEEIVSLRHQDRADR